MRLFSNPFGFILTTKHVIDCACVRGIGMVSVPLSARMLGRECVCVCASAREVERERERNRERERVCQNASVQQTFFDRTIHFDM